MPIYTACLMGADPSLALKGQDVGCPWTGWAPRATPGGWDALTAEGGQKLVDHAAEHSGQIRSIEIARWVEPWTDLQSRFNATGAH